MVSSSSESDRTLSHASLQVVKKVNLLRGYAYGAAGYAPFDLSKRLMARAQVRNGLHSSRRPDV